MNRSKELAKNTIIITIGRVSTQFISFLLLPLYTSLLSKSEYGTVDLVTTLVQLLVPIMSVMIDQGVFRFLLNCDTEEEKKATISCAFLLLLFTSIIAIFIYGCMTVFFKNEYTLWLLLILIMTSYNNLVLQISRGLKNTTDYALGSFVCSSTIIGLNVLCIAYLKMGAEGMLLATFIGNAMCCVFLFFKLKIHRYIDFKYIKIAKTKEILKYSFPLIPNQLSIWVMNSSDRIIVTFVLGTAANGILAVSHKFPSIFIMLFNIFLLAWHETGALHYFDDDRDIFFTEMINKIISVFSTLCIGIIVFLPLVFNWFVNKAYYEAYYNIPIYLVASLFNVIIGLLGVVYVATKKTKEIAKTTILAAGINILVNFSLIHFIGLYAASISTFIGYLITLLYRIHDTKKYLIIQYNTKRLFNIFIILAICCIIYYLNNKIISILFVPIFLVSAYFFNRELIRKAEEIVEKKSKMSKKMIRIIIICFLIILVFIGGIICFNRFSSKPKEIQTIKADNTVVLNSEKTILFEDFGANDFTCTGFCYDTVDDAFWIGDYGALNPYDKPIPRLIEIDHDFKRIISEITLGEDLGSSVNLQGVAYDSKDNCLWLAIGSNVVEISKDGKVKNTIDIGQNTKYQSNGICYNEDDTLWILCGEQYLLHFSKDGVLLDQFFFNYKDQDHICIDNNTLYVTIGADYQGENNYVCKVNTIDGSIIALYQIKHAYSLEGISIVNNKIMIVNDGLYHSDVIGHSYIAIFDIPFTGTK